MKKVLFSLASAILLFSACSNDEGVNSTTTEAGDLITKVSFDAITQKAASSTAIPITRWTNVKTIQLFLYNSVDGTVAFSDIIDDPASSSDKIFRWKNIPQGTYDLALVANIRSDVDNVATSLNGGTSWVKYDPYNVRSKKINSEIFIDLKESTFPVGHVFEANEVPYAPASEVFTAYASSVKVEKGKTTDLAADKGALQLKREVSLMRIRIDKTNKPESAPALNTVDFAHAGNYLSVQTMPVGLGLKLDAFAGGIYGTASDANRIMIASSGVNTYNNTNPAATDYDPTSIVDSNFTLWKDIQVLPNATRAEGKATDADAEVDRRYVVVLTGWAPKGYEYADESIAPEAQPVYWSGTVKGVFSPNVIREVNMNIKSKGWPYRPKPQPEGELIIEVGAPEDWNSNIETENLDV